MVNKPVPIYFQPEQIVFHVTGSWNATVEQQLISLVQAQVPGCIARFKNELQQAGLSLAASVTPRVAAAISPQPGNSVTVKLAKRSSTLAAYDVQSILGFSPQPRLLVKLIKSLDDFRRPINKGLESLGARLEAILPNWLMSNNSQPGATGGPGNRPYPFIKKTVGATSSSPVDLADPTVWEDVRDTQGQHNFRTSLQNGQQGASVVVAVFDTVPPDTVETIQKAWPDHPLIQSLCSPQQLSSGNQRLTIHPNSALDTPSRHVQTFDPITQKLDPPPGVLQPINHEYLMTDHGLFVSGIIHWLAPQAEFHLYQVLNSYGVGDMLSVTDKLKEFYKGFVLSDQPLVANLSLEFNMPLEAGHIAPTDSERLGEQILHYKPWGIISWICNILYLLFGWDIRPWFDRQIQPLSDICDDLNQWGVHVVAAAGNDASTGQPHARYPAALNSVLGVGALQKFDLNSNSLPQSASYSNLSDRPRAVGITALGGEAGDQGVLGIYIGDFPPNTIIGSTGTTPSKNGWAWWSGTSFAAPIVSGVIARALSAQTSLANRTGIFNNRAKEVINRVLPPTVRPQGRLRTKNLEDVLEVTQGP